MIRLDKYLCDMGEGTRSQVKGLIRRGQVEVNGTVEKKPERKLEENRDQVCVCGRQISYSRYVYLLLNKPAGIVSATQDNRDRTVLDWLRSQAPGNPRLLRPLFPVGRLDKDTEGLLLLTDDGELAHRLLAPGKHVEKTYLVQIDGPLDSAQRRTLEKGVDIGEPKPTRPARIHPAPTLGDPRAKPLDSSKSDGTAWYLTITEGKFHQVKRMMQAVGRRVVYLRRVAMGPLTLEDTLPVGAFRELTIQERIALHIEEAGNGEGAEE